MSPDECARLADDLDRERQEHETLYLHHWQLARDHAKETGRCAADAQAYRARAREGRRLQRWGGEIVAVREETR